MSGSERRLVTLGLATVVLAGILVGWTISLVLADFVRRAAAAVFLALIALFLVTLIGFLVEFKRSDWGGLNQIFFGE